MKEVPIPGKRIPKALGIRPESRKLRLILGYCILAIIRSLSKIKSAHQRHNRYSLICGGQRLSNRDFNKMHSWKRQRCNSTGKKRFTCNDTNIYIYIYFYLFLVLGSSRAGEKQLSPRSAECYFAPVLGQTRSSRG